LYHSTEFVHRAATFTFTALLSVFLQTLSAPHHLLLSSDYYASRSPTPATTTMVGWTNNSRWGDIDIFNLLGLDPLTTNLSWAVIDKRPRQISAKLKPNDPTVVPPEGVSVGLINAFRSDIFDLLHPTKEGANGQLFQADPTIESTRAVADALAEINNTKLINYRKTWDPEIGVPGNWLGLELHVKDGDACAGDGVEGYSTQATAAKTNVSVMRVNTARSFHMLTIY
jgi:hypothetical protein